MFSFWKCGRCQLFNSEDRNNCQACFNEQTQLSPLGHIMHEQSLLFHGYIRMHILNDLFTQTFNIISIDVINLCYEFYKLDIKTLMIEEDASLDFEEATTFTEKQEAEKEIIEQVYTSLCSSDKQEYYMAYRIMKSLDDFGIYCSATNYNNLGLVLNKLGDSALFKDEVMVAFRKATELDPENSVYRYNYGSIYVEREDYKQALIHFKLASGAILQRAFQTLRGFGSLHCYQLLKRPFRTLW